MPSSPLSRAVALVLVVPLLLGLVACDEERVPPTGPSLAALDGDTVFFSAILSTSVYRVINELAQDTLELIEAGNNFPASFPSCVGNGIATAVPTPDPMERRWRFKDYTVDCGEFLQLEIDSVPDSLVASGSEGGMYIRFESTDPLRYTVTMPFGLVDNLQASRPTEPNGVSLNLPADFGGGFILQMTTPAGPLVYELEPAGRLRHGGFVHGSGTARFEDRPQGFLLVEELNLEYAYDENLLEPFAPWPEGSYQIAAFIGLGFFGSVSSFPVGVAFDGSGGLTFGIEGRDCNASFLTLENDCAGL